MDSNTPVLDLHDEAHVVPPPEGIHIIAHETSITPFDVTIDSLFAPEIAAQIKQHSVLIFTALVFSTLALIFYIRSKTSEENDSNSVEKKVDVQSNQNVTVNPNEGKMEEKETTEDDTQSNREVIKAAMAYKKSPKTTPKNSPRNSGNIVNDNKVVSPLNLSLTKSPSNATATTTTKSPNAPKSPKSPKSPRSPSKPKSDRSPSPKRKVVQTTTITTITTTDEVSTPSKSAANKSPVRRRPTTRSVTMPERSSPRLASRTKTATSTTNDNDNTAETSSPMRSPRKRTKKVLDF